MKRIFVATKVRGFLSALFDHPFSSMKFTYNKERIYETNSKLKLIIAKLVRSKIADQFGVIQRIKVEPHNHDIIFSFNRFIKTNNKYLIYLENPLALIHYSTNRNKTLIGKLKLKRFIRDDNLKAIVCLSRACYDTIRNFYDIPKAVKIEQIYPLIPGNPLTSEESIRNKCRRDDIYCLYISSNFNLKGGKDILTCFERIKALGINNIKLRIISQIRTVDESSRRAIENNRNIELYDFVLNKEELNNLYNESSILLNPSRQDSFSMVALEAIKSGNAVLTTDLYALPEMVIENYNGFLTTPKYRFFQYDNMPNLSVWNNRQETIYSDYIDDNIVGFLLDRITYLHGNRNELERLALNSFSLSNGAKFNQDVISKQWERLFYDIT